jgi:hypothetical protein
VDDMTATVRELLTELAWIEDSIRHTPMTAAASDHSATDAEPVGHLEWTTASIPA